MKLRLRNLDNFVNNILKNQYEKKKVDFQIKSKPLTFVFNLFVWWGGWR